MTQPNGHDPVEQAIAKAEGQAVQLRQIQVTIASTGRPAIIAIPDDCSDGELAELCGWMLTQVMGALRADRSARPSSRLVVARGTVPRA